MLIGIAGKTGAGKNHVAALLEERGWRSLDLDRVGHRVLDSMAGEIESRLGPGLLTSDGRVDRRRLGERVFSDEAALEILESITYPRIEEETRRWIDGDDTPAVIHAVNLHKTSLQEDCDAIIWVKAPRRLRRRRVMNRDGRPWSELKGRFRSQNGLKTNIFSPDAEIYSVRNSGNDASLNAALTRILSRLGTAAPGGENDR